MNTHSAFMISITITILKLGKLRLGKLKCLVQHLAINTWPYTKFCVAPKARFFLTPVPLQVKGSSLLWNLAYQAYGLPLMHTSNLCCYSVPDMQISLTLLLHLKIILSLLRRILWRPILKSSAEVLIGIGYATNVSSIFCNHILCFFL